MPRSCSAGLFVLVPQAIKSRKRDAGRVADPADVLTAFVIFLGRCQMLQHERSRMLEF